MTRFEGTVPKTSDTNYKFGGCPQNEKKLKIKNKFGGSQTTFTFDNSLEGPTEPTESCYSHGCGSRQSQLREEVQRAKYGGLHMQSSGCCLPWSQDMWPSQHGCVIVARSIANQGSSFGVQIVHWSFHYVGMIDCTYGWTQSSGQPMMHDTTFHLNHMVGLSGMISPTSKSRLACPHLNKGTSIRYGTDYLQEAKDKG